jgi:hypothetical protein
MDALNQLKEIALVDLDKKLQKIAADGVSHNVGIKVQKGLFDVLEENGRLTKGPISSVLIDGVEREAKVLDTSIWIYRMPGEYGFDLDATLPPILTQYS